MNLNNTFNYIRTGISSFFLLGKLLILQRYFVFCDKFTIICYLIGIPLMEQLLHSSDVVKIVKDL